MGKPKFWYAVPPQSGTLQLNTYFVCATRLRSLVHISHKADRSISRICASAPQLERAAQSMFPEKHHACNQVRTSRYSASQLRKGVHSSHLVSRHMLACPSSCVTRRRSSRQRGSRSSVFRSTRSALHYEVSDDAGDTATPRDSVTTCVTGARPCSDLASLSSHSQRRITKASTSVRRSLLSRCTAIRPSIYPLSW